MTDPRWTRLTELLSLVRDLPVEHRHQALQRACSDDPGLIYEVETLLRFHTPAGDLVGEFQAGLASGLSSPHEPSRTGTQVGPYHVESKLGSGAMGEVYAAFWPEYDRHVALKFVPKGLLTPERKVLLENEARVLARMTHRNIAQLYSVEKSDGGSPVLVMEFVHGEPLDVFVKRTQPSLADRLALFTTICAAVEDAHRQQVVHGDIKPSNIMVSGVAEPKLLDFGIAHRLDAPPEQARGMTLAYASPEQLRAEPLTPAADIYSLGVVLFQLLTDHLPYDTSDLSPTEVERYVSTTEPPPPSQAVASGATTTLHTDSSDRKGRSSRAARKLRGDLDLITLKALRKDPKQRYVSAQDFAADIKAYSQHRPVCAHPRSVPYLTRRFLQRHKAGALIAAGVCLLTVAAIIWFGTLQENLALVGARANLRSAAAFYDKGLWADALHAYERGLDKIAPDKVSPGKCRNESIALLLGAGRSHLALAPKTKQPEAEVGRAISCFEQASEVAKANLNSAILADVNQGLGDAYLAQAAIRGRAPNLERAVAAFKSAAAASKAASPTAYAEALAGLAEAHMRLAAVRDSKANYQLALAESSEACRLLNPDSDRRSYLRGRLVTVLTDASMAVQGGDPSTYALPAIRSLDELLSRADPEAEGALFADAVHAKGTLNTRLATVQQREDYFKEAEKGFLGALQLYDPNSQPQDYAGTSADLGALYFGWSELAAAQNHPADCIALLQKAQTRIEQAIQAFPFNEAPLKWGGFQYNLSLTLSNLGEAKQDANLLEQALVHSDSALRVFRESEYPEQSAANHMAAGHALILLGSLKKDPAAIKKGIGSLSEPIPYLERTNNPQRIGILQDELGKGWQFLWRLTRQPGDAKECLRAFDQSIHLFTPYPELAALVKREREAAEHEFSKAP